MGYISAQQAAEKWGISKRRVQVLCAEGRIKGATRIGNMWVVPGDAVKPADGRNRHTDVIPTVRGARTALKKLTVNGYQEINGRLNAPGISKMVFVSLLAVAAFCDTQSAEFPEDKCGVFLMISPELLGSKVDESDRKRFLEMFSSLLPKLEAYVARYSDYVDDILSWAYQYVNKLSLDSGLEGTQFFTETYMIEYLTRDITKTAAPHSAYLDPACGGGNFLSHILNQLYVSRLGTTADPAVCMKSIFDALYGYELDPDLAVVASVNLKLKALMLLAEERPVGAADWQLFCPNIFTSVRPNGFGFLEADFAAHEIRRAADGRQRTLQDLTAIATGIYTNPPFQTVKGMPGPMKEHLKKYFSDAKCDLCNAFILQCVRKIRPGGTIALVTQSSWMYLDSFVHVREAVVGGSTIEAIADLGSGAFHDLSGEKANVTLLKLSSSPCRNGRVRVLTVRDAPIQEKAAALADTSVSEMQIEQTKLFGGEHMAFMLNASARKNKAAQRKYGDFGVPMQGTSTGDADKLIGYYWEHLNDPEWVPVSKGGSYARWCGLNSYVLNWGTDGEYIRATKGSALRNTRYFDRTALVYSDTGTSGFNARLLEKGQLFVASGPGIRDVVGSPYAHLALLNSRVFSYFLRSLSPKLTVAAGYISRVPVPEGLLERTEMDRLGHMCYNKKREQLKLRPHNLEWEVPRIEAGPLDDYIYRLFIQEMRDEAAKLRLEKELDDMILDAYALDETERLKLDEAVGVPAAAIMGTPEADGLDRSMAQALDANCQIARTRANRHSLGCDGILELTARREQVDPCLLAGLISSCPALFPECTARYKSLVLHNLVLAALGFRTEECGELQLSELRGRFAEMYPGLREEWVTVEAWISVQFNSVHTRSFCGRPYYHYEHGSFTRTI